MKKANSSTIMALVLICLVLIILIYIIILNNHKTKAIAEERKCIDSIDRHLSMLAVSGRSLVTEIDCPTKYVTLEGKKPDEIKFELAELMRSAWKLWKEGKKDMFGKGNFGVFCHVYAVADFKETGKTITGFNQYLDAATMPFPNDNITYLQYIKPYETEDGDEIYGAPQTTPLVSDAIDTNKNYAIIFYYVRGADFLAHAFDTIFSWDRWGELPGLVFSSSSAMGKFTTERQAEIKNADDRIEVIFDLLKDDFSEWTSFIIISEYDETLLKDLQCQVATSLEK